MPVFEPFQTGTQKRPWSFWSPFRTLSRHLMAGNVRTRGQAQANAWSKAQGEFYDALGRLYISGYDNAYQVVSWPACCLVS
jgi:hypothetical protein